MKRKWWRYAGARCCLAALLVIGGCLANNSRQAHAAVLDGAMDIPLQTFSGVPLDVQTMEPARVTAAAGDVFTDDYGVKYEVVDVNLKTARLIGYDEANLGSMLYLYDQTKYNGTTYKIVEVADRALAGTDITAVYFPETVTSFGTDILAGCNSLDTVCNLSPNAELILPIDLVKDGVTISGWKIGGNEVTSLIGEGYYGEWHLAEPSYVVVEYYDVEFYIDNKLISTVEVPLGEYIEEPEAPTKEGYLFGGWSTTDSQTSPELWKFDEDKRTATGLVQLYAVWVEDVLSSIEEIKIGDEKNLTLEKWTVDNNAVKWYSFTPTETGNYVMYATASNCSIRVFTDYANENSLIANGYGYLTGCEAELEAGTTYYYRIANDENLGATRTWTIHIEQKGIDNVNMSEVTVAAVADQVYSGVAQYPELTITYGGNTLVEGTDYTIMYGDTSTNVGTATVNVSGTGNYAGTISVSFRIMADLSKMITPVGLVEYTGADVSPVPDTITYGGATLKKGQDYAVTYKKNGNNIGETITGIGNYTAVISGINGGFCTGSSEFDFEVTAKDIKNASMADIPEQTYTGSAVTPVVTITDGNTTLIAGTDYEVAYSNNTAVGNATVTITGKGNYSGTLTKEFQIVKETVNVSDLTIDTISNQTYTGIAVEPSITVKEGNTTLTKGTDYTVTYANNINVGTATVTIIGKGDYTGTKTTTFQITAKNIETVTVAEIRAIEYTGSEIKPSVDVKDSTSLVNGKDYTVTYSNNVNAGTANITIAGRGNYTGNKTIQFIILQKDKPVTVQTTYMEVAFDNKTVQGINLSDNWTWTEEARAKELAVGKNTVTAEYVGEDKANYKNLILDIVVLRAGCDHPETSMEIHNKVEPDCDTEGYSGDTYCAKCETQIGTGSVLSANGHSWNDGVIEQPATEDVDGKKVYTCAICGGTKDEIIPAANNYPPNVPTGSMKVSYSVTRVGDVSLANCANWQWTSECKNLELKVGNELQAEAEYVGSDKDNYKNTKITIYILREACTHEIGNTELRNEKVVSCLEAGYTGDTYCKDCGSELQKGTVITATGHRWDAGTVTKNPTIDTEGECTYSCMNDGCTETRREELPKLTAYPPNVPSNYMTVTFAVSKVSDISLAGYPNWKWIDEDAAKTLEVENTIVVTAEYIGNDKEEYVYNTVAVQITRQKCAHETIATRNSKEADCLENGHTGELYCTVCETVISYGEEIPATGHSWDNGVVTKQPTTSERGERTYTCANCGETKTEELPILEEECRHETVVTQKSQKATCLEKGYTGDIVCSVCGELITKGEEIPATGHSWDSGTVTKESTTTERGECTYKCTECEETKIEELPMVGEICTHYEVEIRNKIDATCTTIGHTGDTYCKDCGEKIASGKILSKTGHVWDNGIVTTQATTTTAEVKTYTCTICKNTKTETGEKLTAPSVGNEVVDNTSGMKYKVTSTGETLTFTGVSDKSKTSVTIPAAVTVDGITYKVTSIGSNAFKGNSKLIKVTIGNNITAIGSNAFANCKKLKTVKIGSNVTTIGAKAFYKCTSLKSIIIPSKVKSIGKQAFFSCKNLKKITIKTSKLTSKNVGKNAFKGISSKATIKVPKKKLKDYKKMLKAKGVSSKVKIKK